MHIAERRQRALAGLPSHDRCRPASSRVPASRISAAAARTGLASAPPMPSAMRRQTPSLSRTSWQAAATSAKSLCRTLISAKPVPMLPASRQSGKAHVGEAFLGGERRRHRAGAEIAHRDFPRRRARPRRDLGIERARRRGRSRRRDRHWRGCRRSCRDCAFADGRRGASPCVSSGRRCAIVRIGEHIGLARRGLDGDAVVVGGDALKRGDAVDVDDEARPRQPHRHQRHQGLAAGDDLAVARSAVEQPADLFHRAGPRIVEFRRFHSPILISGRPAPADRCGCRAPRHRSLRAARSDRRGGSRSRC